MAHRYDARVMVDEAHATGVVGPGGRGSVAAAGLEGEVDVLIGTLGKSLGGYGAYACCDSEVARYLVNTARTLIFSTGPPPPSVAAGLAALELLRDQPRVTERLLRNAAVLREALAGEGFHVRDGETQIVPLVLGDAEMAVDVCERALRRGLFAQAIRPPTVARGSSRLRLSAMATHTPAEMRWAAAQLAAAVQEAGAEPRALEPRRAELFVYDGEGLDEAARRARRVVGTPGLFVTGTDTDVGKTVVASALAATLAGEGRRVAVFKPAVTGLSEQEPGQLPDHEMLRSSARSAQDPEAVAPYRFGPPVSPHLAAGREGVDIEPQQLLDSCARAARHADVVVVEGVGGLLVPLAGGYLVRDLAAALGFPVLIAARPGLGTINHTLMTLECARAAGLAVAAVVFTPWPDRPHPGRSARTWRPSRRSERSRCTASPRSTRRGR